MPLFPEGGHDPGNGRDGYPNGFGERRGGVFPSLDETEHFPYPFVDFQRKLIPHGVSLISSPYWSIRQ